MNRLQKIRHGLTGLLLCIMLSLPNAYGSEDFNIKHLSTQNGLSNNYVTCICQDNLGFIWLGTRDGLNRWDGQNLKVFRNQGDNPNSLPDNFIRSLSADNAGNLWIGTSQMGAVRYNNKTEKFHTYPIDQNNPDAFPSGYANSIFKQNDSLFWFGSNVGLVYYNKQKDSFKRIYLNEQNKTSKIPEPIISIFSIDKETIGIQSTTGIYKIKNGKSEIFELCNVFSHKSTLLENNPIYIASNGDLWFADPDILYQYQPKTKKVNQFINDANNLQSLSSNDVSSVFEDSKNNIWITTWDGGANLFHAETGNFTRFSKGLNSQQSLSDNTVTGIFEDSFENLWLITEAGGANYISLKPNRIHFLSTNSTNTNNKVGSFLSQKDDILYIGTGNGSISAYNTKNKSLKSYAISTNNSKAEIVGISKIKDHNYYVAGWSLGLYQFNTQAGTSQNVLAHIPDLKYNKTVHGNIRSFAADKQGFLWLSTHSNKGLTVYNPETNTAYNTNNPGPIDSNIISVPFPGPILIDSKDRIWVGSHAGLYLYDGVQFYEFNTAKGKPRQLSSNYINTLYEDAYGNIWVGNSVGLDKVLINENEIRVEQVDIAGKNFSGNIKSIIGDRNKRLWLSSTNGIIRYDMQSKQSRFFHVTRDATVMEFSEGASTITPSGDIFFGTTHGFLTFHPDSMEMVNEEVPIYITDIRLFNEPQSVNEPNSVLSQSILYTDTVKLKYNQKVITIEFTPLEINDNEQLSYEYMLKGVDKAWIEAGKNRLITYANIGHGSYDFIVRAKDHPKLTQTQIHWIISPPLWRTKGAYIFYTFLLSIILMYFRRTILNREKLKSDLKLKELKIQNVQENNLMKLRFFTNISHEFRTPLTLIKVPLEKLIKQHEKLSTEEQAYQYELMLNSTNRLDKMLTQLMDYRKMEAGSLVLEAYVGNLIDYCYKIYSNFESLAQQRQIKYSFSSVLKSKLMAFDPDKLEKVISNLLSNAFKNTSSNESIEFRIKQEHDEKIIIEIADTGIGIPEGAIPHIFERFFMVPSNKNIQGTGIGLALAKELVEIHQGQISVQSKENEGTTFSIQIPTTMEANNTPKRENSNEHDKDAKGELLLDEPILEDKLLIIDDDSDMLEFLRHELSADYHILTARDGEEGVKIASEEKPQLILSDLMMPKMDGIELCKKIKTNEATSHIPIILLTARHSDEKKIEGLESGANAYLQKPFNLEVLHLTILNILNSRKELFEQFKEDPGFYFENNAIEPTDQKLIQGIIDLVLENITNNKINADFIAKRVFVSRTVLYIKMEALTGQTVNEFIASIRLKKARQLLLNPEVNISEVSVAVGYTSQSYFSRSFTKAFGCSPRKYINDNIKD